MNTVLKYSMFACIILFFAMMAVTAALALDGPRIITALIGLVFGGVAGFACLLLNDIWEG